jgi:hypothetical protein
VLDSAPVSLWELLLIVVILFPRSFAIWAARFTETYRLEQANLRKDRNNGS